MTVSDSGHAPRGGPPREVYIDAFMEIGEVLAESGLPVCVVHEGGYSLERRKLMLPSFHSERMKATAR